MRIVAAVVLLVLLAPLAVAALPALPTDGTDIISGHYNYDYSTGQACNSYDPLFAVASTDLTSRLGHETTGGITTFTLHLDAPVTDATCPTIDLVFTSTLAWPPTAQQQYATFSTSCGLSGYVYSDDLPGERAMSLYFQNPAGMCGLEPGNKAIWFTLTPILGGEALVCAPLVLPGCTGIQETNYDYGGCGGSRHATAFEVAGFGLVQGSRQCQYWTDGREHADVDAIFVQVDTTSDSCTVYVFDPLSLAPGVPCPEPVRDAVYGEDWGHVLP